jgi:SAM-dependent methyltransferase
MDLSTSHPSTSHPSTSHPSTSHPYPPLNLATRVCCLDGSEDAVAAYEKRGAEARAAITQMLPTDWSFDGKRVLDFGCGAGRTLRHFLSEARDAEFWGCDIDRSSIEWIQNNLGPPLHALTNDAEPPLGLGSKSFDLVWALSVFTHLTDNSIPWLIELNRLLRPGGLLIATYMGRFNGGVFTHEAWDESRIGMNILRRDQPWDLGGPVVLMSDWWVREHWGRAFEVLRTVPSVHGQTWALLQKRDVELTVEDIAKPSDDPREYAALRHNVLQVERDRRLAVDEVRRAYESSNSWRITRPLRSVSALVRGLRERHTAR